MSLKAIIFHIERKCIKTASNEIVKNVLQCEEKENFEISTDNESLVILLHIF